MPPFTPLPDLAALEQVRARLWRGRAAAFVGAGLSLNAQRASPSAPPFPVWSGLAEAMAIELYPSNPSRAPSDVLRLAQEYEHAMTRNTLDALLLRLIPDDLYTPSPLHVSLLELSWADVLTTNYDTLLERAARRSGQRYSTVYQPDDLARTAPPRIVKLHGSFPSHTPFILTEDDFRRYPRTHTPFVSLAQTLLAEHAVLLLGFSGDDPNFLQWSGWVRDHLPSSAPPLFLAGALDLAPPKRTLLEHRGIAPIDLGPLFPPSEWPDAGLRHAAALQWLLAALHDARPPDPLDWPGPYVSEDAPPPLPAHFPALPPSPHPLPAQKDQSPIQFGKPVTAAHMSGSHHDRDIHAVIKSWQAERERDPGWVVPPREVRDRLWQSLRGWNRPAMEEIGKLDAPHNLRLAYEHFWRLNRVLVPLLGGELTAAQTTLLGYNPAPHLVTLPPPKVERDDEAPDEADEAPDDEAATPLTPASHPDLNWAELSDMWMELALIVLRSLRADDGDAFEEWTLALAPLAAQRPRWTAALGYQTALRALDRLDADAAQQALDAWPSTLAGHAFGELHRAAVLAELGDWRRAAALAESVLDAILSVQSVDDSLALASQEGWARSLLGDIRWVARQQGHAGEVRDQPDGWRRALAARGCDPGALLWPVGERLMARMPERVEDGGVTPGFDPGRVTQTYSLGSGYRFDDHRLAFEYLRMREDGAVPLRVGSYNLGGDKVTQAASWIRPFSPLTGYAAPLRAASKDAESIFSRPRIAGLDADDVRWLTDWVYRGIRSAASALGRGEHLTQAALPKLIGLLPVLSRLLVREDSDRRDEAVDLVIRLASRPEVQGDWQLYKSLGTVLSRATTDMAEDRLRARLSGLMALPLVGRDLLSQGTLGQWFDPVESLPSIAITPDDVGDDVVPALLVAVAGDSALPSSQADSDEERPVAQTFAILRLRYLYASGGLTDEQAEAFGRRLWQGTDDMDLPDNGWLSSTDFLDVPPPPSGQSRADRVRRALLHAPFPQAANGVVGLQGSGDLVLHPMRRATVSDEPSIRGDRIDWSEEDAVAILSSIDAWWEADGVKYRDDLESGRQGGLVNTTNIVREQLEQIPLALRDVVLARLQEDTHRDTALRILNGLHDAGVATAVGYPGLLRLGGDRGLVASRVRHDLTSANPWAVAHGAWAVHEWLRLNAKDLAPDAPADLVAEVVTIVATRRRPGLAPVLEATADCLADAPAAFGPDAVHRLVLALEYLRHETEYPSPQDALLAPSIPERADAHRRGERGSAVMLASAIATWAETQGKRVPDEIERWREIHLQDPLPEVRRAWSAPASES